MHEHALKRLRLFEACPGGVRNESQMHKSNVSDLMGSGEILAVAG